MAELSLVRLDYRLIHGQVVTQWVKMSGANRIIIANDELAADEFMAGIYKMSAPQGVKVNVFSVASACEKWKSSAFGDGKVLLLFKDAADALRAHQGGLLFDDLQVGGCGGGKGSTQACGIAFRHEDIEHLTALSDAGVNVHVHVVPTQPDYSLGQVIQKLNW